MRIIYIPNNVLTGLVLRLKVALAIIVGLVVELQPVLRAGRQLVWQAEVELGVPGISFLACRLQYDAPGVILAFAVLDSGIIHVFAA